MGEKTNEITAIPELLEMLNLKDTVVTIDAMGTQRAIAERIVTKGGDYVLSVKASQGRLHDEIRDQVGFALRQLDPGKLDAARWSFAATEESGHDRTEKRQSMVCHDLGWMDPAVRGEWKGLACVIMVHLPHRALGGQDAQRDELLHEQSGRRAGEGNARTTSAATGASRTAVTGFSTRSAGRTAARHRILHRRKGRKIDMLKPARAPVERYQRLREEISWAMSSINSAIVFVSRASLSRLRTETVPSSASFAPRTSM